MSNLLYNLSVDYIISKVKFLLLNVLCLHFKIFPIFILSIHFLIFIPPFRSSLFLNKLIVLIGLFIIWALECLIQPRFCFLISQVWFCNFVLGSQLPWALPAKCYLGGEMVLLKSCLLVFCQLSHKYHQLQTTFCSFLISGVSISAMNVNKARACRRSRAMPSVGEVFSHLGPRLRRKVFVCWWMGFFFPSELFFWVGALDFCRDLSTNSCFI